MKETDERMKGWLALLKPDNGNDGISVLLKTSGTDCVKAQRHLMSN